MKRIRFNCRFLGRIGVWLCDHFQPRPCTSLEIAQSQKYVELMVDVLRGEVSYYGRDAAKPDKTA